MVTTAQPTPRATARQATPVRSRHPPSRPFPSLKDMQLQNPVFGRKTRQVAGGAGRAASLWQIPPNNGNARNSSDFRVAFEVKGGRAWFASASVPVEAVRCWCAEWKHTTKRQVDFDEEQSDWFWLSLVLSDRTLSFAMRGMCIELCCSAR